MAGWNVDSLTRGAMTALTPNTTASGTIYSISGIADDDRFGIAAVASGSAGSSFVVYSGDYQNAGVGNYTKTATFTAGLSNVYLVEGLEGARFRRSDGTVDIAFACPTGVVYSWKY